MDAPEAFWSRIAQCIDWMRAPTRAKDVSFDVADFRIRWLEDGELNARVNCLDRHLAEHGERTAIIFEPDDPATPAQRISYRDLDARTCRLANALRNLGEGVEPGEWNGVKFTYPDQRRAKGENAFQRREPDPDRSSSVDHVKPTDFATAR